MNVFLIARYSRKSEMRGVRSHLEALGFRVVASWLDEKDTNADGSDPTFEQSTDEERGNRAARDLADLDRSDAAILFAGASRHGGMWVELGYALCRGIDVVIVGQRENIYGHLDGSYNLWQVDDLDEAIELLRDDILSSAA